MCSSGMAHRGLDRVGDLVHGVGADHQRVGPGSLQLAGDVGQQAACGVPLAARLQLLDFREVDADQDDLGRMQPAQLLANKVWLICW